MRLLRIFAITLGILVPIATMAGKVNNTPYGVTSKGEKVEVFTLINKHGVRVKLLNYGGTLTEFAVPDRDGKLGNVIVALRDLQAYEARPNFSSLIGRFANRLSEGGFALDGKTYPIASNADGISSHGGQGALSTRVWTAHSSSAPNSASVLLSYVSSDGDNGFPGTLHIDVTFTLDDQDTLTLDYRARTDQPTVLNLTHHAFFNLAGGGRITDERVTVAASHYLPLTAMKIPTGEIALVDGTAFDLRKGAPLTEAIRSNDPQIILARGFDHNFVLDKTKPGTLTLAAEVSDPVSGRNLQVWTTEPGLQLYTGNSFDGKLTDAQGRRIDRYGALALEAQHFPDSPHHPNFPSTELRPGEVYRATTKYRFLRPRP